MALRNIKKEGIAGVRLEGINIEQSFELFGRPCKLSTSAFYKMSSQSNRKWQTLDLSRFLKMNTA
ncbi:conserved hypothetical protein [Ricinus communis]|uniref:Uncharacterized protein n=1 Tax=Ricinus communis TaxID=3988 RepID=B9RXQ6_RICCO|nr:conserved hypothetical protein [Ricinus communis]